MEWRSICRDENRGSIVILHLTATESIEWDQITDTALGGVPPLRKPCSPTVSRLRLRRRLPFQNLAGNLGLRAEIPHIFIATIAFQIWEVETSM